MITIEMAGLTIGIENRYMRSRRFEAFRTESTRPDFTVSVTDEELEAEYRLCPGRKEYLEFTCTYRKIAELLPDYDAFVFHGAVIARQGGAFVFTAPSGTGKTTHINLWRSAFPDSWVLNGDKPVIRKLEGRFVACGTPWCGKEGMGTNAIRPLTAFGILNRGEKNEIRPAAREELLPMMLRQTYRPRDAARLVKQLGLMDACFRALPVYTLYCNMDPSAARMAWETMGRHLSE